MRITRTQSVGIVLACFIVAGFVAPAVGQTIYHNDFEAEQDAVRFWIYTDSTGIWVPPLLGADEPFSGNAYVRASGGLPVMTLVFRLSGLNRHTITPEMTLAFAWRLRGENAAQGTLEVSFRVQPEGREEFTNHTVTRDAEAGNWQTEVIRVVESGAGAGAMLDRVQFTHRAPDGTQRELGLDDVHIALDAGAATTTGWTGLQRAPAPAPLGGAKVLAVMPKMTPREKETGAFTAAGVRQLARLGFDVIWDFGGSPLAAQPPNAERWRQFGRAAVENGIHIMPYCGMAKGYHREDEDNTHGGYMADSPFAKNNPMIWYNGLADRIPCPLDNDYWEQGILPYVTAYAELGREIPLFAIALDYEIYSPVKFANVYSYCFCDQCMARFEAAAGVAPPALEHNQRYTWLAENGQYDSYRRVFDDELLRRCGQMRAAVDAIRPGTPFWLLPWGASPFLMTVAEGLATDDIPIYVSTEATYGKGADSVPDELGVQGNLAYVGKEMRELDAAGINYRYVPGVYNNFASARFGGMNAVALAEVCHGYWFFEDPYFPGRNRDDYRRAYGHANVEIITGGFNNIWQHIAPEEGPAVVPQVPEGLAAVAISGERRNYMTDALAPRGYYPFPLTHLTQEVLAVAKVVILQNFNASLPANSPLHDMLRDFVAEGGGLFLTHDTPWFMETPFPAIVARPLVPPERGDSRHIYSTAMQLTDHREILGDLAGAAYEADFHDHLTLDPGPDGIVLARDEYGYAVVVAGSYGKGRVVFSGNFYAYNNDLLSGTEAALFHLLTDWLAQR